MTITYVFDIDGTICTETYGDYERCKPKESVIAVMRELHVDGCYIILHTARSEKRRPITVDQLNRWGVPYHKLVMEKPKGDHYVDSNALRPGEL